VVFAVNPAKINSHQDFCQKNQIEFPLISDEGQVIRKLYGIKSLFGLVQKRTVVLIDFNGIVRWVNTGMPTTEEIVEQIQAANNQ
jgi:thioredoxin-dependent peroxiredoxin